MLREKFHFWRKSKIKSNKYKYNSNTIQSLGVITNFEYNNKEQM